MRTVLHAGCGSKANELPREFAGYKETRLDANRSVQPDIVASIVAMPMIEDDSYDAVNCSHTLEHLFAHEVAMALAEFRRVLKPCGVLRIGVPDLQAIGGKLALDQADYVLYLGGLGAVTPLDMLYGHRGSVGSGNLFMAHKSGFTSSVLKSMLEAAGFEQIQIEREKFELRAYAAVPKDQPLPTAWGEVA
jgi:ubiquinone/menaquinone biosynthesis C-methylase UbiE